MNNICRYVAFAILILIFGMDMTAKVTILESRPDNIVLEYKATVIDVIEADDYTELRAPGMGFPIEPGIPNLPYDEIKVGIPAGGEVTVNILSSRSQRRELSKRIKPVPFFSGSDEFTEYTYRIDEDKYRSRNNFIRILPETSFRLSKFVPVLINPFQYDGERSLEIISDAIISISITGVPDQNLESTLITDPLSSDFMNNLINPDYARYWQTELRSPINFADFSRSDHWVRVETSQTGMHKITPSQLSFLPVNDLDPRTLRMFTTGGSALPNSVIQTGLEFYEVPIQVVGEEDGSFDATDYIVFYGLDRSGFDKNQTYSGPLYHNPYSGNVVYWLTFAGEFDAPVKRIQTTVPAPSYSSTRTSNPITLRMENESHRRFNTGFGWYSQRWFGQSTADYEVTQVIEDIDTTVVANLSFSLVQEDINSALWHRMNLYINNQPYTLPNENQVADLAWFSTSTYNFNRTTSLFQEGTNDILFRVFRGQTINYFFDFYEITYNKKLIKRNRQYQVKTPAVDYLAPIRYSFTGSSNAVTVYQAESFSAVKILTHATNSNGFQFIGSGGAGNSYWVIQPSDLFAPAVIQSYTPIDLTQSEQIDNVIVCPAEFVSQAQDLADFYWEQYRVKSKIVNQQHIFDQFNGGHPDPVAVRQYLRWVYHNQPAPRISSLTLLGLGTIDWRNNSGQAADKNKIIIYEQNGDAADDLFTLITSSFAPQLAVGRYPVRNSSELGTMLSNMYNYVQNPSFGWWRNSLLIVADDLTNGVTVTGEYYHTESAQTTNIAINRSVNVDLVLGIEHEYDEFQNKPTARDAMMSRINDGTLIWYYIGHGSYDKLGAEDYFNGATDMGRFNNPDRLNLFIAASCKVGHFDYWGFESLAQKVVLMDNLGSVASIAGTRETGPTSNEILFVYFMEQAVNLRNPVGAALMNAKTVYSQAMDNNRRYVLLGDPLLRITPPARDSSMSIGSVDRLFMDSRSGSGMTGLDSRSGSGMTELDSRSEKGMSGLDFRSGSNSQQAFEASDIKPGDLPKNTDLFSRQLIEIDGSFSDSGLSGTAEVMLFNPDQTVVFRPLTVVTKRGNPIFRGRSTVTNSAYSTRVVVPDDVNPGTTGSVISYMSINSGSIGKDYVNYTFPVTVSDQTIPTDNPDAPQIELFLGTLDFREGDTVGTNPLLIAHISDSNGINLTGSAGHNILLILNDSSQPLAVTSYFSYDLDSHTTGTLSYRLQNLSEGIHKLQLLVFDNFNRPAVANTSFIVKKSSELSIKRLLPYPNPMSGSGYITFILSVEADVTVSIYTMSGRKIRTIQDMGKKGFNQIWWDGRDADGKSLANNTYFVKVKAKTPDKKTAEKIEKIVIYK